MKNRIAALREARGLSQDQLCQQLGISRQSLSAIERGKHSPALPTAFRIAGFFALPIEAIFEVESSDRPKL